VKLAVDFGSKGRVSQKRRRTLGILLLASSICASTTLAPAAVLPVETSLKLIKTINGNITPKSVRSSGDGVVSAQNMMYRHSVTFYDAKTFALLKTVPDTVSLKDFGYSTSIGTYQGAPVEGSFSPDGKYLYVTNYAMYGAGYLKEGHDTCSPASNFDKSFLFRINRSNYTIDAVYPVGSVPKVVEVTPDNKYLLVTNWCSYTLTIISIADQKVIKNLYIGPYPRGIAVSKDSTMAYVAEMGGSRIHVINLSDFSRTYIPIGTNPRAIVLSPDNLTLYATLNLSGRVAAWDLVTNKLKNSVKTGKAARSLAVSGDGSALFVVNFNSGTISKLRTNDMKVLQTIAVCKEPIGVTYDSPTNNVWVACYQGQIKIYSNN
jgi:YVTN family beta-propeller protein